MSECLVGSRGGCSRRPTRRARPARRPGSAKTRSVRNSVRIARWNRSTFPVVVGDRGWVSRCSIPFSRQIRSKSTSTGGWLNRPVNTFPLSVRIWLGHPVGPQRQRQALADPLRGLPDHQVRADRRTGSGHRPRSAPWPGCRRPARTRRRRPSATAPSDPRAPTASTSGPAADDRSGRSGSTAPTPGRPPTRSSTGSTPRLGQLEGDPPRTPRRMGHAASARSPPRRPAPIWCGHDRGRCDPSPRSSSPPASYLASQACTVLRDTPNRAATVRDRLTVTDHCQHGLIPLLSHTQLPHARECHQSTEVGVTHQPKTCNASAGAETTPISRRNTEE